MKTENMTYKQAIHTANVWIILAVGASIAVLIILLPIMLEVKKIFLNY